MPGNVTPKGYRRVYDPRQRRLRMEHVLVWESFNGPIPPGYQIHHLDDDRLNNRPENLACISATAHKRLHGGCVWRDGEWWKPCNLCGKSKPIGKADWYLSREGWPLYGRCRPCHIARVVVDKRARKRRRALGE